MTRFLLSMLAMLWLPLGFAESQPTTPSSPQIAVSGVGETKIQPDRAVLTFSVETRASSAAAASADNARRQRAVTDALKGRIGAQDRLSTSGFSVLPDEKYDSGQRKVVGYIARNTVQVETSSLDKLGSLIDAALGAGSNIVAGLSFSSSKTSEARRSALTTAVENARADAEAIAKAAGGSLGSLLEISSSGGMERPFADNIAVMKMASGAPETPITPGEQTLTVSVSARWIFLPQR